MNLISCRAIALIVGLGTHKRRPINYETKGAVKRILQFHWIFNPLDRNPAVAVADSSICFFKEDPQKRY